MSTHALIVTRIKKQIGFSLILLSLGLLLLVYMIVVEDEPGAVPLFLVATGTIWFLIARFRLRSIAKIDQNISK